MKKFLIFLTLSLIFSVKGYSEIIFRDCNLEPNYKKGSEIYIDLEQEIIKIYSPEDNGIVIHNIDKAFGGVLVSSNIMHNSKMPSDFLKFFTDNVSVEMSFDIDKHLVSILLDTNQNGNPEFVKKIEADIQEGKLARSLQDKCNVENNYDPMNQKKLLKNIKLTNKENESFSGENITKLIEKALENSKDKIKQDNDYASSLTLSEEDDLKAQIFGCWSIPLGLPYGEDLLVRIRVELQPDGTVTKTEILDQDRMNESGQGYYKVLAESALRAVKLCQPLRVPSTGYERWKEIILNFDAREMLEG